MSEKPNIRTEDGYRKTWVTDQELANDLDICISTARKIAAESGAVSKVGKIKRNNIFIVYDYMQRRLIAPKR